MSNLIKIDLGFLLKRRISLALILLAAQSALALNAANFVGPLQRNPYAQPNVVARSSTNGALNVRNPQTGQYMSRYVPYYSQHLYSAMKSRATDANLRQTLRTILQNPHQARPGQMDTIIEKCVTGDTTCYQSVNLGYERARLFLMGYFYLVKVNNQYAIKEVYCNKLYGPSEFRSKKTPFPESIPDNTVINVEHTWPQSRFTGNHPRETQKADLHHLFPTDSQLNAIRGNYPLGIVDMSSEELKCGKSKFGNSTKMRGQVFEPPDQHKGRAARALFYFAMRYDMNIEPAQEAVLRSWHQQFPVDAEELLRNDEIYKVQGNRNPFIDHPELVSSLRDF